MRSEVPALPHKEPLVTPPTTKTRERTEKYTDHRDLRCVQSSVVKNIQHKQKEAVASMGQCRSRAPYSQTWGEMALCPNRSRADRQGGGGMSCVGPHGKERRSAGADGGLEGA